MPAHRLTRIALALGLAAVLLAAPALPQRADAPAPPPGTARPLDVRMDGTDRLAWSGCDGVQARFHTAASGPAPPPGFHPGAGGSLHHLPAPRIDLVMVQCAAASRNDEVWPRPMTVMLVLRQLADDDRAPLTLTAAQGDLAALWVTDAAWRDAVRAAGLPALNAHPVPGAQQALAADSADSLFADPVDAPGQTGPASYLVVGGPATWALTLEKDLPTEADAARMVWADGPGQLAQTLGPGRHLARGETLADVRLVLERLP